MLLRTIFSFGVGKTLGNMPTKSLNTFKVDPKVISKHTKTLYEQRRQLGQCFKSRDNFVPKHQYNVNGINMMDGLKDERFNS